MNSISIIIPAYNEEKRIEKTLSRVLEYSKKNLSVYEIIIVDDGSKDKTREVVGRFEEYGVRVLSNERNFGKGYSVKKGIQNARMEYILFIDADLSTPIEEERLLRSELDQGADGAIGSRRIASSHLLQKQPFHRRCMGFIFVRLTSLLLGLPYSDYLCGFKMFKSTSAKKLAEKQLLNRYSFDAELLYLAKKLKLQVREVGVLWEDKAGSTVRPLQDSFISFGELIKVRINNLQGKYK